MQSYEICMYPLNCDLLFHLPWYISLFLFSFSHPNLFLSISHYTTPFHNSNLMPDPPPPPQLPIIILSLLFYIVPSSALTFSHHLFPSLLSPYPTLIHLVLVCVPLWPFPHLHSPTPPPSPFLLPSHLLSLKPFFLSLLNSHNNSMLNDIVIIFVHFFNNIEFVLIFFCFWHCLWFYSFYQHPCIHIYLQINLLRTPPTVPHSNPSSCHIEPPSLFLCPTPPILPLNQKYSFCTQLLMPLLPPQIFSYTSLTPYLLFLTLHISKIHTCFFTFAPPPPHSYHPNPSTYWTSLTYSLPHPSYDIT